MREFLSAIGPKGLKVLVAGLIEVIAMAFICPVIMRLEQKDRKTGRKPIGWVDESKLWRVYVPVPVHIAAIVAAILANIAVAVLGYKGLAPWLRP